MHLFVTKFKGASLNVAKCSPSVVALLVLLLLLLVSGNPGVLNSLLEHPFGFFIYLWREKGKQGSR